MSCCLRIGAHLPSVTTPHAARVPRCGIPVARRPPEERGGPPRPCVFPLQFSPFGNPLSRFPLFSADSTKGGKPQGATARRPFWKTAQKPPEGGFLYGAVFGRRLTVAPPRRRSINPVALDPNLGVSALVRPEPAQPVQGFTRFRPFMVAAFAAKVHRPRVARRVSLRAPQPAAPQTRQSPRQPANDRGLSCRLLSCPKRMRTLFVFTADKRWGGKNKKCFGKGG